MVGSNMVHIRITYRTAEDGIIHHKIRSPITLPVLVRKIFKQGFIVHNFEDPLRPFIIAPGAILQIEEWQE